MKKNIFLLFISFVIFSSFAVHKFYVAVYQIDYHVAKKEFQITSRIFIDDLEKTLEKKHKKKIYLGTKNQIAEGPKFVENYLNDKFTIAVNDKLQKSSFFKYEFEDDVIICYQKFTFTDKINSLKIENSVLIELFSEQQNLTHININGNKKSFLFTNSNLEEKIELN